MAELDAQRTRIYSAAAIAIQKHVKGRIDRKKYIAMRRSCIRLQSYWRGDPPTHTRKKRLPEMHNGSYFFRFC